MVTAENLTVETALEISQSYPLKGKCGVCLEDLVPEKCDGDGIKIVVKPKVCNHFFHKICIEAWLKSSTPNLNICPLDRCVIYGCESVPQEPINLPTFTEFPGHEVDGHGAFYINRGFDNDTLDFDEIENRANSVAGPALAAREFLNMELVEFFDSGEEDSGRSSNSQDDENHESPQTEYVFLAPFRTLPDDDELDPAGARYRYW